MAKYLVTGGAGFIGSNFLSLLLNANYSEVTCIDKFNYAASEFNLSKLRDKPNFSVVKIDISKSEELDAVWQQPFDYIINFAAESHVDRSIENPNIFFQNNVLGTLNLMNKCLEYPPKLFVQISTDEVYGSIPVMDFCKAILAVLDKGEDGEIYNIGSSNEMANLDLVKKILSHLGKDESLIKFVHDRPGHDLRYSLDSTKARRQLNWGEQYPFDLALANTISWYKYFFEHYAINSSEL